MHPGTTWEGFPHPFPEDPAVCNIIRYRYALELVIFWVSLPLILGLVYLWRYVIIKYDWHRVRESRLHLLNWYITFFYICRSSKRSSESTAKSNIATTSWLLLVVHSNITCYFWITYYIIDNVYSCKNGASTITERNGTQTIIAVIGAVSLGL